MVPWSLHISRCMVALFCTQCNLHVNTHIITSLHCFNMMNVSLRYLASKLYTPIVLISVSQIITITYYYTLTALREFPNSRSKSSLLVLVGKCRQFVLHFYGNPLYNTLMVTMLDWTFLVLCVIQLISTQFLSVT